MVSERSEEFAAENLDTRVLATGKDETSGSSSIAESLDEATIGT